MTDDELYVKTTELGGYIIDVIHAWCLQNQLSPGNERIHKEIKSMLREILDNMPDPTEFRGKKPEEVDPSTLKN